MRFWFEILYLVVGLAFLARGLMSRSGKDPFLYFGAGIVLGSIADFLPPSATLPSNILEAVSAITIVAAAILMFAYAQPAKAKAETKEP